jgi:hypothetical protein
MRRYDGFTLAFVERKDERDYSLAVCKLYMESFLVKTLVALGFLLSLGLMVSSLASYKLGAETENRFIEDGDELSIEHLPWFNRRSFYGVPLVAVAAVWCVIIFWYPAVLETRERFQVCTTRIHTLQPHQTLTNPAL